MRLTYTTSNVDEKYRILDQVGQNDSSTGGLAFHDGWPGDYVVVGIVHLLLLELLYRVSGVPSSLTSQPLDDVAIFRVDHLASASPSSMKAHRGHLVLPRKIHHVQQLFVP